MLLKTRWERKVLAMKREIIKTTYFLKHKELPNPVKLQAEAEIIDYPESIEEAYKVLSEEDIYKYFERGYRLAILADMKAHRSAVYLKDKGIVTGRKALDPETKAIVSKLQKLSAEDMEKIKAILEAND